jgi:hypothetical protein
MGVLLTVLKCKIRPSTILKNNGKLCTLLTYLIYNNLVIHVLASIGFQEHKSARREKHIRNAGKVHRRSHPAITQRQEGPPGRANRLNRVRITEDRHQGPHTSPLEEGGAEEAPPGVSRTPGSAELGRLPGLLIFGRRIVHIFLESVAKVSI